LEPYDEGVMRLLVIDFDGYQRWLEQTASDHGLAVIRSSFETALSDFKEFRPDAVIVEVIPREGDDAMFNFRVAGELYECTNDQPVTMCIFSGMDRDEFVRTAKTIRDGFEGVAFFSKAAMEIPPLLQCIRDEIVYHPELIGGSWLQMLPKSITSEWISEHEGVYPLLCSWILEHAQAGTAGFPDKLHALSPGIANVWSVFSMESRIDNAGMLETLVVGFGDDSSGLEVDRAVSALRRFGCVDVADVVDAAAKVWRRFLESLDPAPLGHDPNRPIACGDSPRSQIPESVEQEVRRCESEFYDLAPTLSRRISSHIRRHPLEFVAEVSTDAQFPAWPF
jgi:hypothetical protein